MFENHTPLMHDLFCKSPFFSFQFIYLLYFHSNQHVYIIIKVFSHTINHIFLESVNKSNHDLFFFFFFSTGWILGRHHKYCSRYHLHFQNANQVLVPALYLSTKRSTKSFSNIPFRQLLGGLTSNNS